MARSMYEKAKDNVVRWGVLGDPIDNGLRSCLANVYVERPRRVNASRRSAQTWSSVAGVVADASFECIYDLQFKAPAFMGLQD
jgi:hypothetical protein